MNEFNVFGVVKLPYGRPGVDREKAEEVHMQIKSLHSMLSILTS